MDMNSGGSLETAIAVGSGAAVDTAFFVMIVLMEPVGAFGTTRPITGSAAINTF